MYIKKKLSQLNTYRKAQTITTFSASQSIAANIGKLSIIALITIKAKLRQRKALHSNRLMFHE